MLSSDGILTLILQIVFDDAIMSATRYGLMVELMELLQRDTQASETVQKPVVVIRNALRTGVYLEAFVEFAFLRRAAEFGVSVAAAQRSSTAA